MHDLLDLVLDNFPSLHDQIFSTPTLTTIQFPNI